MTTIAVVFGFIVMFFLGLLTGAALATLGNRREEKKLEIKTSHRDSLH
jgi:hypothetical protein